MNNNNNNNNNEAIQQSSEPETLISTQEVMTFVDDQQTNESLIPHPIDPIPQSENQANEEREHTIKDFLQRPIQIGTFVWSSSQTQNTNIFEVKIPQDLIQNPMFAEKLNGFTYLKGTVRVKVFMNRQPFQAGMLQIRYLPVRSPNIEYNSQLDTMKQFSGLNGIKHNIESDMPIEIDVPYNYPIDMYDLIQLPDSWATLMCRVYAPLRASTDTSINMTVFAHFLDDIELTMPNSFVNESLIDPVVEFYNNINNNSMVVKRNKIQIGGEQVAASNAGGPISTIAGAVGQISQVASMIPGLGAIGSTVGMVSNVVGSLAQAFGFSKPSSNQILTQVRPALNRGMANSDFADSVTQTALITDNNLIEARPICASQCDEMSLAYMSRIGQFVSSFTYSTSDEAGKRLAVYPVNPVDLTSTFSSMDSKIYTTTLGLVCSMFQQWRGKIHTVFDFAKTEFHSGRLIFVWFNAEVPTSLIPTTYSSALAKNYSMVMDLKEKFSYDIEIPYCQANPWLYLHSGPGGGRRTNGTIAIYVLNQLQAPPTVTTSINVLMEVRGGNDLQFSIPQPPSLLGYWINPDASAQPPETEFLEMYRYGSIGDPITSYTQSWHIPWEGNVDITYVLGGAPTEYTTSMAPASTVLVYNDVVYPIGGRTVKISFTGANPQYFSNTISVAGGILDVAFSIYADDLPFRFAAVQIPSFLFYQVKSQIQMGREEQIDGASGVSIAPAISQQKMNEINGHTVGETILSTKQLLKRYEPTFNYKIIEQFERKWLIIDPMVFSNTGGTLTPYQSLLAPAFRFWSGSRRYKVILSNDTNNISIFNKAYKAYLIPGMISDTLLFDPSLTSVSTNLYYIDKEGSFEFSIPYYNRNRCSIIGDVTNANLLSPISKRYVIDLQTLDDWSATVYTNIGEDFQFASLLSAPTLKATPM